MNKNARNLVSVSCVLLVAASVFLVLAQGGHLGGAQPAADSAKSKPAWKKLSDGKSLAGWKETKFGGEGEVYVEDGTVVLGQGNDMTGITYAGTDFPRMDYEVTFEAKKIRGNDFFATTTFPVGKEHCSLVVGGWGGGVVGLSNIDDKDASENETSSLRSFGKNQWYRITIRVTSSRIAAWIDDQQVVNFTTKGRHISVRPECDLCKPFGIATWRTIGAVRDIRVRTLGSDAKRTTP